MFWLEISCKSCNNFWVKKSSTVFFSHAFFFPLRSPPSAHGAESVEMLQVKKKQRKTKPRSGPPDPSSSSSASISWEGLLRWFQLDLYGPRRLGLLNKLWIHASGLVFIYELTLHPQRFLQSWEHRVSVGLQHTALRKCHKTGNKRPSVLFNRIIRSRLRTCCLHRRPFGSGWVNEHLSRAGPPRSARRHGPPGHIPCFTVKSSQRKVCI